MPKMIFVNLPVQDLAAATSFYEAIGCEKNPLFSDDKASCMVWSDSIYFMVLSKEFFSSFTSKAIADARTTTEVLTALSFDRRSDVDAIADAMLQLSKDEALRQQLIERGYANTRRFSWEKAVRETLAVFEKVLGRSE